MYKHIRFFKNISLSDIAIVGGKNASLGELQRFLAPKGVNLPNGFATTAQSYFYFLEKTGINAKIVEMLRDLNVKNLKLLAKKGSEIRKLIMPNGEWFFMAEGLRCSWHDCLFSSGRLGGRYRHSHCRW
jgi:pyruvate,water dikinase